MRVALMFAGAIVGAAMALATASGASAAEPKCGLSNGKAATGQPIEIGAVVGKTGPADFSGSAQAAAAYFACVNANGGINGRPIHYSVEDDQWNPETAAQVAAKLVNDIKVVGMVGNSSFVECAANSKFYETNNVLVIAGVGVPRDCFHSRNIAPTNGGPRMSNIGAAQYMHDELKVKRLVCIVPNIPNVGDWVCDGITAYGKSVGMEVKTIMVDPSSMDATSVILEAMSFKPDAIDISMPKEGGIPLFAAAEQQDLGGKVILTGPTSLYDFKRPEGDRSVLEQRRPRLYPARARAAGQERRRHRELARGSEQIRQVQRPAEHLLAGRVSRRGGRNRRAVKARSGEGRPRLGHGGIPQYQELQDRRVVQPVVLRSRRRAQRDSCRLGCGD